MTKKTEPHAHCWHVTSSTTDGLAIAGWDAEVCCHCGRGRLHHWRMERDPAHGPYAEQSLKVYAEEAR